MSDQLRESVSALMDGEADELEIRRLLSLENSEGVSQTWSRYHLLRDVLQGSDEGANFRHLDISAQVSQSIEGENSRSTLKAAPQWWRPMAGFAVAASVAVAVVVGVQSVDQVTPGFENTFPASGQPAVASRVYPVQGASMQASTGTGEIVSYQRLELPGGVAASRAAADLEAQKRLEKYMLRHTESAVLNNGQGMISYARVANFEVE